MWNADLFFVLGCRYTFIHSFIHSFIRITFSESDYRLLLCAVCGPAGHILAVHVPQSPRNEGQDVRRDQQGLPVPCGQDEGGRYLSRETLAG